MGNHQAESVNQLKPSAFGGRSRGYRSKAAALLGVLALSLGLVACSDSSSSNSSTSGAGSDLAAATTSGEKWPDRYLRIITPSGAGGGQDALARLFSPLLSEKLGVQVIVQNLPGGNMAIGGAVLVNEGQKCDTLIMHSVPHIHFSFLTADVTFTYDDFYPVGSANIQPAIIAVGKNSPYETIEDLISAIRDKPGQITASISSTANNNYAGLLQMQDLLGVDINIVGFGGGGPARNAVASGEIDFTHAALFGALPLADELRFLAIHQPTNDYAHLIGNVPTLSDATGLDFGTNASYIGLFAHRECFENYPERYAVLNQAWYEALTGEEGTNLLEELDLLDSRLVVDAPDFQAQILKDELAVIALIEESDDLEFVANTKSR